MESFDGTCPDSLQDSEPYRAKFREAADHFLAALSKQGSVDVLDNAARCCKYAGAPGMASKLFDIYARCSHFTGTLIGAEAAAAAWRRAAKSAEEAGQLKQVRQLLSA
jgi:hypothetical protein